MVLTRLGDFLYRAGWVISGLLLFDVPPTIFAYAGFAAGWTNVADCIALGVFCTTIGCLSWLAGRAMGDVLTPDIERLPTGAHPGVRARLCRRGDRLRFSSPRRMSPEIAQVFGRRRRRSNHALWRPAAEKRQCTKSRREIVGLRLPRESGAARKAMEVSARRWC